MSKLLPSEHILFERPSLDLRSFPEAIDNTIRGSFTKCKQCMSYSHINKLSPQGTNVHLHAGAAFATGMEFARKAFYVEGKSHDDAIALGIGALVKHYGDYECPSESAKSLPRMCGALEYYFSVHPMDSDFVKPYVSEGGEAGIEFSFAIPLPIEHPDTGQPLLYSGRFDMLGKHENNSLFIVDEKTATSLGAQWSRNWELDSQFTGYCWGARQYGIPVAGALIRGVSILKTKYDHADAIIYRPDWQIQRWYEEMLDDVREMVAMYKGELRTKKTLDKHSCNSYGGCAYTRLCASESPATWVDGYYEINLWDPLKREKHAE